MEHNALKDLYIDELKDLYDAENRLVKALPKMAKASTSDELRSGIEHHLEQTRGHVDRLKEIFDSLDEKPSGKKCAGMMGILKEGDELLDEDYEGEVLDAGIISAAQRVEHYEIAAYGTVRTWADLLGENEASGLLEKTLEEEKDTERKLTELAEKINVEAKQESEGEGEEGAEQESGSRKSKSARA
jgi:ferritin-like metal-binding protein YciE